MTTSKNILNKKNFNNYLNDYINTINEEDSYMNLFSVFPTNNIINKNVEFNYKEEYSFKNNDDPQDDEESNENVEEIINIKNNFVKDSIKIYFNNKIYKNINSSSIGKNIINMNTIKNIFHEKTENSNINYIIKEMIINKNEKESTSYIFYNLLIQSQEMNENLFQEELFGNLYIK